MTRLRSRLRDEAGMSLVEILVGIVLMSVVMAIASSATVHAMKVQRRQVAEVDATGRARNAMERMGREVRAANPILAASADGTSLTVQVTRPVVGNNRKITTYTLVGNAIQVSGSLVNTTTNVTTPMTTTTLLTGVALNPGEPLFSYRLLDGSTPTPTSDLLLYRTVTINLRMGLPEGASAVLVSDTVTIRNAPVL